jgi:hypothetical protein
MFEKLIKDDIKKIQYPRLKMTYLVNVQLYLPNGEKAEQQTVSKITTLRTIIKKTNLQLSDVVVFTGAPEDDYNTPLVNLDATLEDVNMCCSDKSYVANISIFNVLDISKYNFELYNMYYESIDLINKDISE